MKRPTTDEQKRLRGTYKPSRRRDTPKVAPNEPPMPPSLSAGAQEVWQRIVPALASLHVLTDLDADALVMLCELRAQFESDPVKFAPSKLTQLRVLLTEFGLTPASRPRAPRLEAPESNPFDEFASPGDKKVVTIASILAETRRERESKS